jgi:hypothetical protein
VKVSGFSIVRNAQKYHYPVVEAISSVLPLCDEFIINVGKSDDETLDIVKLISSPKVRIIEREWDLSLRTGGRLISEESNNALNLCEGEWCFYIQADEVLHEKYVPAVRSAMERHIDDRHVEGLQFRYKHFYGSYDYFQDNYRRWYVKESRIIRRSPDIVSWGDGMDFRHRDGIRLRVKAIEAEIYHYGWVRPPSAMFEKRVAFNALYSDNEELEQSDEILENSYVDLGHLKRFTDTHPQVMKARIEASSWHFDPKIEDQPPDWWRQVILFFQPVTKRISRWRSKLISSTRS